MKYPLTVIILLFSFAIFAQKPCEYATNVVDSIGSYKSTKDYIVHERNFAGNEAYMFFNLLKVDDMPLLNLQYIQKSADMIKVNCLDANSRVYLQLQNGQIITLIHTNDESCGTMVRVPEENKYTRVITGNFMFMKGSIEALKASPVTLMRVKFSTEILDFVFKKELTSEMSKQTYQPEKYFIDYLQCVD
ncbi:hypothetical protein [Flavobacterium sp. 3HN19-14]|uniref:hypothetical protein n=1 Tax=Flavobacterium sp. 3HN19-14 TaxID=3448133 RepID=UPI003EDF0B43